MNIFYSKNDLRRNIMLPDKLSSMLAEDVGFHVGDGYMKIRDKVHYEFVYTGNNPNDLNYFEHCLIPRKNFLFNFKNLITKKSARKNYIELILRSKCMFFFYRDVLGVQESPKTNIKFPTWIFNSLDFQNSALRGLIDSDGCFRTVKKDYPIIDLQIKSLPLATDVARILENNGIKFSFYHVKFPDKKREKVYTRERIAINGRKNVLSFINSVGFSNEYHIKRIKKWMGRVGIEPTISAL